MADLGEQARKMDIALKYTNGDMEMAKQMVAGKINDIYIIKGKAEIGTNLFGLFIINVFFRSSEIMAAYAVASTDPTMEKFKAFVPLSQFAKEMVRLEQKLKDQSATKTLVDVLSRNLTGGTVKDIVRGCDKKNLNSVSNLFNVLIANAMKGKNVNVQLDIESSSSFNWEYSNLLEGKVPELEVNPPVDPESGAGPATEEPGFMESPEVREFEKKYEKVIEASAVVSPVKGLSLQELQPGDQIKVILPTSTPEQRDFAIVRGGMEKDGKVKPIAGIFRKVLTLPENEGFLIYADLPGRILMRIFEESRVKIALAEIPDRLAGQAGSGENTAGSGDGSANKTTLLILAAGIGLLLLIGILSLT